MQAADGIVVALQAALAWGELIAARDLVDRRLYAATEGRRPCAAAAPRC